MSKNDQSESLFTSYQQRHPELVVGARAGIPTSHGEAAYDVSSRNEPTRQLSGLLGDLALEHADKSLDEPVTVVESMARNDSHDTHFAIKQAASGVIDHLLATEVTTPNDVSHHNADGIITKEAKLAPDTYLRVQVGRAVARVVLSPTSHFE